MNNTRVKLVFDKKCSKYSERVPSRSVWFLIDKSLQTVQDVQAKICDRYAINARRLDLFVDDSLIPSCESAGVFRETDAIFVKIKKKKREAEDETQECETPALLKTPTFHSEQHESGKRARKRKVDTCEGGTLQSNGQHSEHPGLVEVVEIERKGTSERNREDMNISNASVSKPEESPTDASGTKRRRRKRTRTRKKKDQDPTDQSSIQNMSQQESINTYVSKLHITQPVQRANAEISKPKKNSDNREHVYFSEGDDDVDAGKNRAQNMETNQETHFVVNSEREAASIVNMSRNLDDDSIYINTKNDSGDNHMCISVASPKMPSGYFLQQDVSNDTDNVAPSDDVLQILQACKGATTPSPKGKHRKNATDVVKNAVVFNRKSFQWKSLCPPSKTQQLACKQKNVSVVLQNPPAPVMNDLNKPIKSDADYSSMNFHSLPAMKQPPGVGQRVAFKMLELGPNFTPEVSDFKVGKVLSFNAHSKCLEIELLAGNMGGVLLDDSVDAEKIMTITWTSMLEPKVMKEESL